MKKTQQIIMPVNCENMLGDEVWLDDMYFNLQMAKLSPEAPRACLAYRVSTKGQVEKDDIPMQKIECRKFCAKNGWRVVIEKAEKGISGSKISANKRDVIQEIKKAASDKRFDIFVVYMFDRLGRIESETPFVLEWFVKNGIEMWSTREGQQKIETHDDKLINYIRFWQAAGESEKTSIRIRTRMRQIVSSGHYTGGAVMYGYRAVHQGRFNKKGLPLKDLEVIPEQAAVVKEIFEKVALQGYSAYGIMKDMNDRGFKTHSGGRFSSNAILRMIRHRGYKGEITTEFASSGFIESLKIVDETLFDAANNVIEQRAIKNARIRTIAKRFDNPTLLAGLVLCGHCGAKMSGFLHNDRYKLANGTLRVKKTAKYNCFQRSQKLRECDGQQIYKAEIIDKKVISVIDSIFKNVSSIAVDESIAQKIKDAESLQQSIIAKYFKEMSEFKQELQDCEGKAILCLNNADDALRNQLSNRVATIQDNLLCASEQKLQEESEISRQIETLYETNANYQEFLMWAQEFPRADLQRQRMILSKLLQKVEVKRGYDVQVFIQEKYCGFIKIG